MVSFSLIYSPFCQYTWVLLWFDLSLFFATVLSRHKYPLQVYFICFFTFRENFGINLSCQYKMNFSIIWHHNTSQMVSVHYQPAPWIGIILYYKYTIQLKLTKIQITVVFFSNKLTYRTTSCVCLIWISLKFSSSSDCLYM